MKEQIINGIKYRLNEETLTAAVTYLLEGDSIEDYVGDIKIPETIEFNGVPYLVTSIEDSAFSDCESLTSITIPDSVTSIGRAAFDNCDSLEKKPTQEIEINRLTYMLLLHNHLAMVVNSNVDSETINIPSEISYEGVIYRVTSIWDSAFYCCESLTSITIPDSVTCIGEEAFLNCSLKAIVIAEGNTVYDSRENCNAIIETATNTLILSCQNTTIPNSVTSIGDSAFYGCDMLTSITIPDSVTTIGKGAFTHCPSLTSIVVAEGNTVYDSRENCNAIIETATNTLICGCQNTTIPNSVTSIGDSAFSGCSKLADITLPNSVTSIGDSAFCFCESLTSINIPNSVTSIGDSAFSGCSNLADITIPNSVTSIEAWAFNRCKSLTSITIPNSVTSIGRAAFSGCSKLADITLPNSLTSIEAWAFNRCKSLTSINIPNSVTTIGDCAFEGCKSLTSIVIQNGVTTIGESAFKNCESLTSVTIPCSVTSIGEGGTFQGCTSLKSVQWNAINCTIDKQSNGNYHSPFANISNIKNFTFGNNVKSIPACLCYELSGLTSIVIPDSITSIGYGAFYHCSSLKAIDIPDSVMIIEACAFLGCKSLKIIALPSNALIIEDGAFADCNSWRVIRYGGTVKQCERRYRYWDQCFHHEIIYCTDGDTQIHW